LLKRDDLPEQRGHARDSANDCDYECGYFHGGSPDMKLKTVEIPTLRSVI
jgi:hypothetical protein